MKRLTALLLALLLVVGLAACGTPDAPESPDPTDTTPVEPSPSPENSDPVDEPPAVELTGTMYQVVTVNMLGEDVDVTIVRNFDTGAYRFDYFFKNNDVYAAGIVLEDGTWQIDDTNNDFTFGTIELFLPLINDAAWAPCDDPFGAPSDDPVDEPPAADVNLVPVPDGSVMQVVKVNMMGTDVEIPVIVVDHNFHFHYSFMENPYVYADGTVDADGNWTVDDTNVPFISGTMGLLLPAIQADAWTAYDGEWPVKQPENTTPDEPAVEPSDDPVAPPAEDDMVVEVEVMGNKVPITVTLGAGTFELDYSMMGNDVNVKGTIGADGTWTMTEATNPMASNIVPLVQAACNVKIVEVEVMGNKVPVTVALGEGTFEMHYEMMGNAVAVKGTVGEDGTWTMTEATNDMAANMVPLVQAAVNA